MGTDGQCGRKRRLRCGIWLSLAALCAALCFALLGGSAESLWPAAPSRTLQNNGKLKVDATHINDGYFQASIKSKTNRRMKLRVKKGSTTLTYDLNSDANFEVFPLQLGKGRYEITLYEQVSGSNYSAAGKVTVNPNMRDEEACFYYPNQYVNYTRESPAALYADEHWAGLAQREVYDALCEYIRHNFTYDFVKALNIKAGVLPDIDGSYAKRMGICQDLTAIMCCMLRSEGIPARLMIGDADGNYHAWLQVRIGGEDLFFDPTAAVNRGFRAVRNYTIERYY